MADFDVIVVGAGHNSLISAAYLAQAGHKVGVFERRDIVGGAVSTVEHIPGYRFDLGGSAHILIRLTPIVEELGLEKYGLEYLELDPLFFAPFPDGDSVFFYRDAEKTIDHLESKFPGQGKAYKRFLDDWTPFAELVRGAFLESPSPFHLGKRFVWSKGSKKDWQKSLSMILKPYNEVADWYFEEEKIKAPMVWMAAQSGPPPTEPLSAPFFLWHPLYHKGGIARPRGGSGMLTQALARHIEDHGGKIFTSSPVEKILVESGKAIGIRSAGNEYTARAVLSGTHAYETFGKMMDDSASRDKAAKMRIGNGFGLILRLALDSPIEYKASPGIEARTALQLVCRSRDQIMDAYGDFVSGRPTQDPPIVAMSFSAVDDTLAPPGHEVLWLWAQYYPYELRSGSWSDIEEQVTDRLLDTFEEYAPGTRKKIVGSLLQHPEWLEQHLGLYRGNVMHLEMSLDQMFMLRPSLGVSKYKAHVKGLYLTGASTHPGGGIMGASGRNAARVLLKDLSRRKV